MLQYSQSLGILTFADGTTAQGYSGNGPFRDDPAFQAVKDHGPIPQGDYVIGDPLNPPDHLGPLAMPLHPDPFNEMYGRGDLFLHGDNAAMDHTASDGCIILDHATRLRIAEGADRALRVTA